MARVIRGRVVPGEIVDAREEGAKIVAAAQDEATRLVEEAKAAAEAIRAEATEAGRGEGRGQAAALIAGAGAERDRILREAEGSLVELALAATRQVVGAVIDKDPSIIRDRVARVLEPARRATKASVRVHPGDTAHLADLVGVRVEADETLAPGDCVITTELGTLDGRVEVQLEALKRALKGD